MMRLTGNVSRLLLPATDASMFRVRDTLGNFSVADTIYSNIGVTIPPASTSVPNSTVSINIPQQKENIFFAMFYDLEFRTSLPCFFFNTE